jgi:hypothetical protein
MISNLKNAHIANHRWGGRELTSKDRLYTYLALLALGYTLAGDPGPPPEPLPFAATRRSMWASEDHCLLPQELLPFSEHGNP